VDDDVDYLILIKPQIILLILSIVSLYIIHFWRLMRLNASIKSRQEATSDADDLAISKNRRLLIRSRGMNPTLAKVGGRSCSPP
jgi:hypothetical protein